MKLLIETLTEQYKDKNTDVILCVTGDHSTPVRYGDHSHEPVPVVFGLVSKVK